jgi:hypothetical protein
MTTRRQFLLTSTAASLVPTIAARRLFAAEPPSVITVYKDAGCQCCVKWVQHLSKAGFVVMPHDVLNMDEVKKNMRVPAALQSCHTGVVDRYVVEGHVPADVIKKMLAEKPEIQGIAVPGMPTGSPGMEGARVDKYDVIAFTTGGKTRVYAKR